MTRVIAVTGATGFIGSAIVQRLLINGLKVKALVRPCSRPKCFRHPAVLWVEGDLSDRRSLKRLVTGTEAVIHCAGAVRGLAREDFDAVNAYPVHDLVDICNHTPGISAFLLISSLAARHPDLSFYAMSKRKGESALSAINLDIRCAAFRPPAVYGPGDREIRPVFKLMKRGIAPVIAGPGNRFSLLHVHDLAEAVFCWLNSKVSSVQVYELHDGLAGGYSWEGIAALASQALGRRILKLRVPLRVLSAVAFFNVFMSRLHGSQPMLTPGKVRELVHSDWVCDNKAICEDTAWRPGIRLQDALKQGLI